MLGNGGARFYQRREEHVGRESDDVGGSPFAPGTLLLGRYEYVRVLGRGAMGEVLDVRDRMSGQRYALKRIPPELVRNHAQMGAVRANFNLVQGLTHPHIAVTRFLEADHATGQVYILMDLVRGRDLQAWLEERRHRQADPAAPLPLPIALGIAEQAASALDYAHSLPIYDDDGKISRSGILHRDLKPANMMVVDGRDYRPGVPFVQLVDFGLAAEIQASLLSSTMHVDGVNRMAGTPLYMAPEQWAGRTLTRSIDQWALAVMLYEMAEGGPPFHASTREELRTRVLTGDAMPPEILSHSQWNALKVALDRDRTKRYPNCTSLVQAVAAATTVPNDLRTLQPDPSSSGSNREASPAVGSTSVWPRAHASTTPGTQEPPRTPTEPPLQKSLGETRRPHASALGGALVVMATTAGLVALATFSPFASAPEPAPAPAPPPTVEAISPVVLKAEGAKAGEERSDNALGMKMVWCPPGKFLMGSPATDAEAAGDEKPQVEVELSRGFWLGKYEVTQGEWKGLMGTEPWKDGVIVKEGADYAATYVRWEDGESFCKKLTERDASSGKLSAGWSYRLPSEAEWEYACRAGSATRYGFGDDAGVLGSYAWYDKNASDRDEKYANQVGLKKPNRWGLHDVHGNVWEWCGDWYGEKLLGGQNPLGPLEGSGRVNRGGSWGSGAAFCRSASRFRDGPWLRLISLGFRVARVPDRE